MTDRAIRALDERTVERIAAGEVVDRPASIVKELVENSLDAGADRIVVTVESGGTERVRIRDDGAGIPADELDRAVDRHTTSKLRNADQLTDELTTLGFRGEALHTIGAISRMTVTSRQPDADRGAELVVEGGDVGSVSPAGCPVGTTVDVRDVFYNVPARREFLGTTETEFDHVNRIVTEYGLANPGVAIVLNHGDREVFATSGRGSLQEAILAVWGREVAENMIDVELQEDDWTLGGMISDPETTRSRPRYLATFVNGRAVRSRPIRTGLLDGYGARIGPDRYPFAVLFCDVPASSVDVNVHPRKTEVRFNSPETLTEMVSSAIDDALHASDTIPSTAPRGRGAPAETSVTDFEHGSTDASAYTASDSVATGGTPTNVGSFRGPTTQQSFDEPRPGPALEHLPSLRVLGQIAETYIVAEADGELVLVDQHAADERINFERLRSACTAQAMTQELVEPVDIALTGDEAAAFAPTRRALERLGFVADAIDERTLRVSGVPTVLDATVAPDRIRDAIGAAVDVGEAEDPIDAIAEAVLADMACYPAITGNEPLASGPIVDLLERLDACDHPYACPHGRPTVVRIDRRELEDRFERDYPGHAARRPDP